MSDSPPPSATSSAADIAPGAAPVPETVPALRWRTPRWRAPFLRALGRYGNVRLAAEAAGIDKTVCYTRRRSDPAFAAAWDRAKARAAARLVALGMKPVRGLPPGIEPGHWSKARGDDGLVIYGGHGFTAPRLQRPRRWGWSADKERVFLQTLADSCNVRAAGRAIGMTLPSLYKRRAQGHHFAAAWDAALDNGLAALQAKIIQSCGDLLDGKTPPPCFVPSDAPVADITDAIWLLREHKSQRAGTKRRGWRPAPLPPPEEVRASILRKIDAIVRARGKGYLPKGALIRVEENSG